MRAADWLSQLVAIPSHQPDHPEEPVARQIAATLAGLGAEVHLQEVLPGRPNAIGIWRFGPGPAFLLTSHTDVVPAGPEQYRPRLQNGRLYGRGACDAKGQLAAMLEACAHLAAAPPAGGTLVFAACVGEESSGVGTDHLVARGLGALDLPAFAGAVVGEPTECAVVHGHRGAYRARVTFTGKAAHSSDPSKGSNALYDAARFMLGVERLNARLGRRRLTAFGRPRISATVCHGGSKVNVVPGEASVQIDRRLCPGETGSLAEAEVLGILRRIAAARWQVDLIEGNREPAMWPARHAFVQSALAVTGEQRPAGFIAGTDQIFLVQAGIPSIILGPGALAQAHTADEFIELSQLGRAAEIYAALGRKVLVSR